MSRRNARANLMSRAIEAAGWRRDPWNVPDCIREWGRRFPDTPIVADGREVTGFTRDGRGTTAFDLFRQVNPEKRVDFLSLKSDKLGKQFPSKVSLSTGNLSTVQSIEEAVFSGTAIPTVIFVSRDGEDGEPEEEGYVLFLDLGKIIREAGGFDIAPEGGYSRGKAPPAYLKWSSARTTGKKDKHLLRRDMEFPCEVEGGEKMFVSPSKVKYREAVVSLYACGVRKDHWIPCNISDLPDLIDMQDWNQMSVGWDGDLMIG